jgi:predicted dehydrogenase
MDRFRVVILGTGFGRTVQAVAFGRHPGFELAGIAGANEERTRRIAHELGIPHASGDWRRLLAELSPDLVSVVTPPDLHHPMAMAALEGGAHLLCEKPTALHRFQAAEVRDRALALSRVAAINHEFRFFPARRQALALVREGAIGTPRRGEIHGRYPIWHRPESRGMNWLSERRRGGGVLGALGSHHTDCLRTFFGEPGSVLASVRVLQPRRGPTADRPEPGIATADDAFTLHYDFAQGVTGLVDLNATTPYRWERFEIQGSDAALRWDETGYKLWRIVAGREPEEIAIPDTLALEPRSGEPALVAPFGVMIERLSLAMRGERAMEPNFDDAVAVQSALDAARASSDAGARVAIEIPPRVVAAAHADVEVSAS